MSEFIRKPTLYLETTVPSCYTARESSDIVLAGHQYLTREWWDNHRGDYTIFVSELVLREAARGDTRAAERRLAVIGDYPVLRFTQVAIDLAGVYMKELPIPERADADALHLALATLNFMDYLVTWNCRHIARGSVIRALPVVNSKYGYKTPTICTPEELIYDNPANLD